MDDKVSSCKVFYAKLVFLKIPLICIVIQYSDCIMPFNIPILLTWMRISLIPLFVALFYVPVTWCPRSLLDQLTALIFAVAALTDWLDGFLARAWDQTSSFGAFLDPVADKLMVAAALIMLVQVGRVDALIALVIIGREITISALREWMAQLGQHQSVAVHLLGKIKTTAQMIAILMLLHYDVVFLEVSLHELGTLLIYVATILTLWSMVYYLNAAAQYLKKLPS